MAVDVTARTTSPSFGAAPRKVGPPEQTSAKPTPLRAGTMMAPTFGCWPLSRKPLVVTAVRAAREDGAGGDRSRVENSPRFLPMRF
jgi:hypothetical protein